MSDLLLKRAGTPDDQYEVFAEDQVIGYIRFSSAARTAYRRRDELRATILIACSKCEWRVAFSRDELIAEHGADYPMPDLLSLVAAPGCRK
jgi:hypothetical protein